MASGAIGEFSLVFISFKTLVLIDPFLKRPGTYVCHSMDVDGSVTKATSGSGSQTAIATSWLVCDS